MASNKKHIAVFTLLWNPDADLYYWRASNGQTSQMFSCKADAVMALANFEIEWKRKSALNRNGTPVGGGP